MFEERTIEFTYTNHRGVTERRRVLVEGVWRGETEYHPEEGTPLLRGFALDRGDEERQNLRDFDLRKIVWDEPVEHPGAPDQLAGALRATAPDVDAKGMTGTAEVMRRAAQYLETYDLSGDWRCAVCGLDLKGHLNVAMGAVTPGPTERFIAARPGLVEGRWRDHAVLVVAATAANAERARLEGRLVPESTSRRSYHERLIRALYGRVSTEVMADAIEEAISTKEIAEEVRGQEGRARDLAARFGTHVFGEVGDGSAPEAVRVTTDDLRDLAAIAVMELAGAELAVRPEDKERIIAGLREAARGERTLLETLGKDWPVETIRLGLERAAAWDGLALVLEAGGEWRPPGGLDRGAAAVEHAFHHAAAEGAVRGFLRQDVLRDAAREARRVFEHWQLGDGEEAPDDGPERWLAALDASHREGFVWVDGETPQEKRTRAATAARHAYEHWAPDPAPALEETLEQGGAERPTSGEGEE